MTRLVQFEDAFGALAGHRAFPWQQRLYQERFVCGAIPSAVDIPVGSGKIAVMAIGLLARAADVPMPRRLVYVVDRRAVVDQATEFVEQLRERLEEDGRLGPVRCGLGGRPLPILHPAWPARRQPEMKGRSSGTGDCRGHRGHDGVADAVRGL